VEQLWIEGRHSVAAILLGSWGPDHLTFCQCGGPNVHGPPRFSAVLLYVACNPCRQFCRQWLNFSV